MLAAPTRETPHDILAVDDTPENLKLLSAMLKDRGFRVRPVPNGRLALRAARGCTPDLILLDINMPDMDGYEVCRELKADPDLRDVPVIFISALSEVMDKVEAFGAGGVDYVTKPFQFEEVEARVRTHLRIRELQQEVEARHNQLQENYDELRRLEDLRDNLVHMIVHDMRSPLMGIFGNLQFLSEFASDGLDEQSREDLQCAMDATQGLNEMVSGLLDINRLESGEMPLSLDDADLRAVIQAALESLGGLTRETTVVLAPGDGPLPGRWDAEILRRVVVNLVSNAIKFTPPSGTVTVTAGTTGDGVRVEIADTGSGIPEEYREKIFDKFGQVEARERRRKYSTGLGLTFCKLAVEAHGGTIGVDSTVGEGSRFWFEVPRAAG